MVSRTRASAAMKDAGGNAAFAPAPLPLPPRGRCRLAKRCFLALAAWPWLTLVAIVAAAVGLAMFDERMRDALDAADTANTIVDGSGLREWTAVARSCVTAVTVIGSVCLGTSLLAVCLAAGALRTSRCPVGCRPRPTLARASFVYVATLYSLLVSLAMVAALSASTIGAVGAKAAELVAGYGATLTNQVATLGNTLVTRAAPLASALGGGGGATRPPSLGCPVECFDAARYPFLNSKQCVCGRELLTFRDNMAETFDVAVVGVVGAGVAAAALVLLWGTTAAHAARVWQLRCRSSRGAADAAARARGSSGDDESDEFAPPPTSQPQRRAAGDARGGDGDAVIHIAEWPPVLVSDAGGSPQRRGGTTSSTSLLPQGPQQWGPYATYTWSYEPPLPSPRRHERTRSM